MPFFIAENIGDSFVLHNEVMSISEDILGIVSTLIAGLYQCICIYTSDIHWEEELQYIVCSKTVTHACVMKVIWSIFQLLLILLLMFLLKQCQENTVVCSWIGEYRLYVMCMQECGRRWKNTWQFQDCVYSLVYLEQNPWTVHECSQGLLCC